ncbi:thioredoxin domain-containing protein [Gemmatimonas sp.]|uniref:DsbA family protein n=1 Tax=Gemmatimonas sp. TaxID=1962908 RepID=UPI00286C5455|nr:thioredoxin domain-containing protein [Gemmatimonas sp.]
MAESSRWGTISSALLTVCALLVTAAVVRREFFPPVRSAPKNRELREALESWGVGRRMGPESAPVALLVFSDFQCPFCSVLQQNLKRIRERYPDAIRVEYRHMPIENLHPYAFDAALAAECAGDQDRFERFHDALFESQDSIPSEQWSAFARKSGVADVAAFERCVTSRRFDTRVKADMAQARTLKLSGTPSVIVGSTLLGGTPSVSVLDSIVRANVPSVVPAVGGRRQPAR